MNSEIVYPGEQSGTEKLIVPRLFSKVNVLSEPEKSKLLEDFLSSKGLVVLGDPGSGKTTSFKQAAKLESNAIFLTVREFIRDDDILSLQGNTLYLDALDEKRASASDGLVVIDDVIKRLNRLGKPVFRLSCRYADWKSALDEGHLKSASSDDELSIIQIESLSEDDISKIVENANLDSKEFFRQARVHDVLDLLGNPQRLNLFITAVGSLGAWPETKKKLYETATKELAEEKNPSHDDAETKPYTMTQLLDAAGYLCALQLIADKAGFALKNSVARDDYPAIQQTEHEDVKILEAVLKRNLFSGAGPERFAPAHRTVAEYLGARYLAGLVLDGLPLSRVVTWITGPDGGTLPDLRGLFAWLVTLLPETKSELLISRDPVGTVIYGDPASFSISMKVRAFEELERLSKTNPYFLGQREDRRPYGAFSIIELSSKFVKVLNDIYASSHLRFTIFDALEYGATLPELESTLLNVIFSDNRDKHVRLAALRAYKEQYRSDKARLLKLLNKLCGNEPDLDQLELCDSLLRELYPDAIDVERVIEILRLFPFSHKNKFVGHFRYVFSELIPMDDIPLALDAILGWGEDELEKLRNNINYSFLRIIGDLLIKALRHYSAKVDVEKLWRWLGIPVDKYGYSRIQSKRNEIAEYFEQNPELIKQLIRHWLLQASEDTLWREYRFLMSRIGEPKPTKDITLFYFEIAASNESVDISKHFFNEAISICCSENNSAALTPDEVFAYGKVHPRVSNLLAGKEGRDSSLCCDLPQWWMAQMLRKNKSQIEAQQRRIENRKILFHRVEKIRSGHNTEDLCFAHNIYSGRITYSNEEKHTEMQLQNELGNFIASAAIEGFENYLYRSDIVTPEESGSIRVSAYSRDDQYLIITGTDILFSRSPELFLDLPERTLEAVAHLYVDKYGTYDSENQHAWFSVLCLEKPELVASSVARYIKAQINNSSKSVDGAWLINNRKELGKVMSRVVLYILWDYPVFKDEDLKELLQSALIHSDRSDLLLIAKCVLSKNPKIKGGPRLFWQAVAALLDRKEFGPTLKDYIRKDEDKAVSLLEFIYQYLKRDDRKPPILSVSDVEYFIKIIANAYVPKKDEDHLWDDPKRLIESIFAEIAKDISTEAVTALENLKDDPALSNYSDYLHYIYAQQAQKKREAEFKNPSLDEAVKLLKGGPPVNAADMAALVNDHLLQIIDEIQNGAVDAYKQFWNTGPHGNTTDLKDENTCRDVILDKLRDRVALLNISVEREGDYARHTRSDIKALWGGTNHPIEIKHQYHPELWTAPATQLIGQYMREGSVNYGTYLVLWSGNASGRRIPRPPKGVTKPTSPAELLKALKSSVSVPKCKAVEIIVMDISGS